jgi:cysteine desulfurase
MLEEKQKIKFPIYMDCHATTPVDKRVLEAMLPYFTEIFGNTASIDHTYGISANQAVDSARGQIAEVINCKREEIIFTSGATESDNLALLGIAERYKDKGNHIITCTTEHKAILDSCKHLEKNGKKITYLPVDRNGKIDLELLEASITDKTILISIMAANNEIGTIAELEQIGRIAHEHGILFHTDAAQAVGHIPIDVEKMHIDLMSMSAHKMYGPKGIGALYCRSVNPRIRPYPIIHGGGHERGVRSGTLNVPAIAGFGKAIEIANQEMDSESKRLKSFTSKILKSFIDALGDENIGLNGHPTDRLPHNLNVYLKGIENKALINYIQPHLAISAGSACTTTLVEPSHVIIALGYPEERAYCSIRFGLSRSITDEEVDIATKLVVDATQKLRHLH